MSTDIKQLQRDAMRNGFVHHPDHPDTKRSYLYVDPYSNEYLSIPKSGGRGRGLANTRAEMNRILRRRGQMLLAQAQAESALHRQVSEASSQWPSEHESIPLDIPQEESTDMATATKTSGRATPPAKSPTKAKAKAVAPVPPKKKTGMLMLPPPPRVKVNQNGSPAGSPHHDPVKTLVAAAIDRALTPDPADEYPIVTDPAPEATMPVEPKSLTKVCSDCHVEKPIDVFREKYARGKPTGDRHAFCNACNGLKISRARTASIARAAAEKEAREAELAAQKAAVLAEETYVKEHPEDVRAALLLDAKHDVADRPYLPATNATLLDEERREVRRREAAFAASHPIVTKNGTVLSDADVQRLSDEAEATTYALPPLNGTAHTNGATYANGGATTVLDRPRPAVFTDEPNPEVMAYRALAARHQGEFDQLLLDMMAAMGWNK